MDNSERYSVVVVGAGAAGLMAALRAAECGKRTLLLEKNTKAGVKILMSGGTRCNLTQNTDSRGIIAAYGDQGRFLHSALALLSPQQLVKLFNDEGVATKIEDTNKIFPASDKALDVLQALLRRLHRSGAELALGEPLSAFEKIENGFALTTDKRRIETDKLILTTGGQSYPGCGTIGEGFAWARSLGHRIVPPRPALVPLTTQADWVHGLSGLTMPDVGVSIVLSPRAKAEIEIAPEAVRQARQLKKKGTPLAIDRGSLLFTHVGFSGPVILNVSRAMSGHPNPHAFDLLLDFLPDVKLEALDEDLRQAAASDGKRSLVNLVGRVVPRRLAEALLQERSLPFEQRAAELGKAARRSLVEAIKQTAVPLSGTLGFKKAEVTAGGVALDEVDSHTMESRLVSNLFFAGEILDIDGPIGGYNFQAAFATGMLAGESV
ncbi:MAG TPA: NAD(P)/FAD-dependent oxidoreductase [Pirellulaceae bacterium]|nr:NAD(P)/FAD-dependent oxidoreductase [Pirellulaceae bacterium]